MLSIFLILFYVSYFSEIPLYATNIPIQQFSEWHLCMLAGIAKCGQILLSNPDNYRQEEIYATVDLISDPNNCVPDINKARYCKLRSVVCTYRFEYER